MLKDSIRAQARQLGFADCRFTSADPPEHRDAYRVWLRAGCHGAMAYLERTESRRIDPRQVLSGARTAVVVALNYAPASGSPADSVPPGSGVVARYARYADYHRLMGERLECLAEFVCRQAGAETRVLTWVDTGPVLERDLAQRAGLGFIGKHTNLIHRQLGNWVFLGGLYTTAEVPADPAAVNRCGKCGRCLLACPTGAITRPFHLDARRCLAYLTIEWRGSIPEVYRPQLGRRIFGCDDCLAVCPWNRFSREAAELRAWARADLRAPDLLELLALDEAGFRRRFADTPLARLKRRGLRRNVCVALGNVGGAEALPALAGVAAEPEPLVAEHAAWARLRILARADKIFHQDD